MREIKYRVWNSRYKCFSYWGFLDRGFCGIPTGTGLNIQECFEASEQFTGLKDKAGTDIYEGDKIICTGELSFLDGRKSGRIGKSIYGVMWIVDGWGTKCLESDTTVVGYVSKGLKITARYGVVCGNIHVAEDAQDQVQTQEPREGKA